jgi:hypothetical protein
MPYTTTRLIDIGFGHVFFQVQRTHKWPTSTWASDRARSDSRG